MVNEMSLGDIAQQAAEGSLGLAERVQHWTPQPQVVGPEGVGVTNGFKGRVDAVDFFLWEVIYPMGDGTDMMEYSLRFSVGLFSCTQIYLEQWAGSFMERSEGKGRLKDLYVKARNQQNPSL